MEAVLESFIQEVNGIDDAGELRRRLVAMKKELLAIQNRESEYLRSQKESALLFEQTEAENKGLREENKELRAKLEKYGAKDTLDRNRLFGRQTEKTEDIVGSTPDDDGDPLSEDAEPGNAGSEKEENGAANPKKKQKHGKRRAGKHAEDLGKLPRQEVYDYDPDALDRIFGKGNWRIASWHASTKKEVIPAIVYAKTTYTPVVSVGLEHSLVSMPPSKQPLLAGSDASETLVAWIMNNKFVLGIPTYRLEGMLRRRGISISRQTMTNWINSFSRERFCQVSDYMAGVLRASGCTQCDETTLLVIRDGRKAGRKSFMWIHITSELGGNHPVAVFTYEPDRSTDHLRKFYDKYIGEIICDAYSAYHTFETENGDTVIICGCWMHARRRWAEALRVHDCSGLDSRQVEELPEVRALRLIGDIYKEEGKLKDLSAEDRLKLRRETVRPKVEAYFEFLSSFDIDDAGLSDRMKDAISYSLNQKKYLCRFLSKGNVPIDNGACERKARAFGIGRNNWMFCTSPSGAEASAIMYTLVETAKSNGADPFFYLKYLLERTPSSPALTMGKKYLEELMPWSGTYIEYEKKEKKAMLDISLPPSDKEPTGKKLMKYSA